MVTQRKQSRERQLGRSPKADASVNLENKLNASQEEKEGFWGGTGSASLIMGTESCVQEERVKKGSLT